MVVYTRIHLVIVSIHTPTQGVTFLYICNVFRICFNPHTHAGCDTISFYSNTIILCFNPHTHAGCDGSERYKEIEALVSIHTPTQGVTLMLLLSVMWYLSVSIHTPTQGVTTISALFEGIINLFQSTHPRRV